MAAIQPLRAISRWLGRGVIGWDLAADEGAHPLHKHLSGVRRALELQVPVTVSNTPNRLNSCYWPTKENRQILYNF